MKQRWLAVAKALTLVLPFQLIIYAGLFIWGVYWSFRPEPMAVSLMMPRGIYLIWLVLHMLAPTTVWTGQLLVYVYRKPATTKQLRLGWELQWMGDASLFFVAATIAYAFSLSDEQSADFLVPSFLGLSVIMLMLALRDAIWTVYYWGACHQRATPVSDVV